MALLALLVLVLLAVAVAPAWPYSRAWGYYPSGVLGTALIVVAVLALMGRI